MTRRQTSRQNICTSVFTFIWAQNVHGECKALSNPPPPPGKCIPTRPFPAHSVWTHSKGPCSQAPSHRRRYGPRGLVRRRLPSRETPHCFTRLFPLVMLTVPSTLRADGIASGLQQRCPRPAQRVHGPGSRAAVRAVLLSHAADVPATRSARRLCLCRWLLTDDACSLPVSPSSAVRPQSQPVAAV